MVKTVKIGDKTVKFKASAATPRLYRIKFNRDIFTDYEKLITGENGLGKEEIEIFEDIAYIMAKQADCTVPDTAEEWLDKSDSVFTIYTLIPTILELWNGNTKTTSEAKKKVKKP